MFFVEVVREKGVHDAMEEEIDTHEGAGAVDAEVLNLTIGDVPNEVVPVAQELRSAKDDRKMR